MKFMNTLRTRSERSAKRAGARAAVARDASECITLRRSRNVFFRVGDVDDGAFGRRRRDGVRDDSNVVRAASRRSVRRRARRRRLRSVRVGGPELRVEQKALRAGMRGPRHAPLPLLRRGGARRERRGRAGERGEQARDVSAGRVRRAQPVLGAVRGDLKRDARGERRV